jgi:hypothetical protein
MVVLWFTYLGLNKLDIFVFNNLFVRELLQDLGGGKL